jgi:hypothetical protein
MPNFEMFPLQGTIQAATTLTTNTTSAVFSLPYAQSFRFVVETNTVSGTLPTMQVIICTSLDGGTTYDEILSFTQITTTGLGRQMTFRPYLGYGDTATEFSAGLLGTTDLASGVVAQNGPIDPAHMKLRFVFGGTTPSFNVAVKWLACTPGMSD